jgi:CRP/FNR family transcriptional regulator, cyclic AMP receptor protein
MTIHTLEPIIHATPFFEGMEQRHIELITGCATNVRWTEGETIFRQGDSADHFYLVRSGLVSVQLMVPHRGMTTILTVGEGEILGWSWLFSPYRWHFDARAQRPTYALAFDGKCLRTKCDQDHDLGYEILKRFMQVLNDRLESTRLQLLDIYGNHT